MVNYSKKFDFSVLLSVYKNDDPGLFYKSLQSIFFNNMLPLVVVVVCDGDLPNEINNVIYYFENKFPDCIDVIRKKYNSGLADSLNIGIGHIKTEWIVRADADDINLPNRFEEIASYINENKNVVLVGSAIQEVDKSGKNLAIRRLPETKEDIYKFLKRRSPFNHMSVAYRADYVKNLGGYPDIYLKEDYGLWVKFVSSGADVANIKKILVNATTGKDMYKRRGGIKYAIAEIKLQRFMVAYGVKSIFEAIFDGMLRSMVFLAPARVREFIYLKFLRNQ